MPDIYDQDLDAIDGAAADPSQAANEPSPAASGVLEQGGQKPPVNAAAKGSAASTEDSVKLSKEEYADFQRMRQTAQLSQIETDFKKSYPDFDMQKVTDKILELDEKTPGAGDALLNAVGLENVYLKYFHGKAQPAAEDEFDVARGIGGGVSVKELIGKINKGEASESEKQALYTRLF